MAMTVGMCFAREFPGAAVTEFARRLDAGGVDELWLIEDCFYTTAPPLAAAALATTERLTVGLGILPAVVRTAALTAMEIATLASIAPGRVVGGIGHGVQSWMAQMGVATPSPLTTLDEVVTTVRRLLRGERVTVHGREVTLEDVELEHVPEPTPPVLAGVTGPRSLALAGRVADGIVLAGPTPVPYVAAAREHAAAGADFRVTTFTTLAVADDPVDAYRAVASLVADMLDSALLAPLPFLDELTARHARDGVAGIETMPRDWWLQIGAIGTRDDALEHLALLEAAGTTGVAFFPSDDLAVARGQVDDVIAISAAR
ncbi:MAG TPA: LLM class flavin-dependent oxidoreductase [Ornithinibacter sp.]|nr:LLM class flavin-dependent oxidoreductase [Ornithinibacter sp.]